MRFYKIPMGFFKIVAELFENSHGEMAKTSWELY